MRVHKKTFHEHRRLQEIAASTSLPIDLSTAKEPCVTGHNSSHLESGHGMESVMDNIDDENSSCDDPEEQEQPVLFDDEDQVFFSDTGEQETGVPCYSEVSTVPDVLQIAFFMVQNNV